MAQAGYHRGHATEGGPIGRVLQDRAKIEQTGIRGERLLKIAELAPVVLPEAIHRMLDPADRADVEIPDRQAGAPSDHPRSEPSTTWPS